MKITLRKSIESDLGIFFQNQADEEANFMAAFTSKDPADEVAYLKKWKRLMGVDTVNMQTILLDEQAVGCVVKFEMEGDSEITYAVDKRHWGQGITSIAVKQFLEIEEARPIFGRVANDNHGSRRILEKTGFKKIGTNVDYANARGQEIEEFIYRLDH